MERRQDSLVPSVLSAGTDPAHVPGLDEPPAVPPEQEPGGAPDGPAADEAPGAGPPDETSQDEAAAGPEPDADEDGATGETPEGPAFEASDRRGAIVADGSGILFRLDDTEARLGWNEIGAVEVGTAKFGRRFSVTVYTTKHRCYDGDVEAASRKDVRAWTEEFDAVLDAWFDDGAAEEPRDVAAAAATSEEDTE